MIRRIPGQAGVWVFILGDMVAFALMFGVLVVTQGDDPGLYEASQGELHVAVGAVNTAILLTSSLLIALAVRAARGPRPADAVRYVAGTVACALAFAAAKVYEYADLGSSGISARTNDFFLYYFTFTGIHLMHVAIGLAVLVGVLRLVRRPTPLSDREVTLVETGTSYWHMVDLLWIVLFALLYLLG